MRLVLIGPPGSGKGTQAQLLCERLHLFHFGMGDLLREAIRLKTRAGELAEPFVRAGKLVPDRAVNQMIEEKYLRENRPDRFVMDGYPRTYNQALALDEVLRTHQIKLNAVIQFLVEDEAIVRRLSGRRVCTSSQCGANYHLDFRPPKVENVCDLCGSALEQRSDDVEETVRGRLQIYHANSEKLLEHYQKQGLLRAVEARNKVEEVFAEIVRAGETPLH
jgi:adenylate kinase